MIDPDAYIYIYIERERERERERVGIRSGTIQAVHKAYINVVKGACIVWFSWDTQGDLIPRIYVLFIYIVLNNLQYHRRI